MPESEVQSVCRAGAEMPHQASVYEKIVSDVLAGRAPVYKDYAAEWRRRGHHREEFAVFAEYAGYAAKLVCAPDFEIGAAVRAARTAQISRHLIPEFLFTPAEKKTILRAEEKGRIKAGQVIAFSGCRRKVFGCDYSGLPDDTDAFVVFSGHPGAAGPAVFAWFNHFRRTGRAVKLIFLGLTDNQGNSDFTDSSLIYNVGSEQEMYRRYFKAMGVSHEIIDECVSVPYDISTEDNIARLAEIKNKIFGAREVKFVMFGYPVYQTRIATEFAWAFQKMEDEGNCFGVNFIMPSYRPSQNEYDRYFSYDNLNGIAADIIIGNCMAHPYRVKNQPRFDIGLGTYPEAYKRILPLSLVYSYPNVAAELAGTDIKTAAVLKILRTIQHRTYGYEHPQKTDRQISYNVMQTRRLLLERGLVSRELSRGGYRLPREEYLRRLASCR